MLDKQDSRFWAFCPEKSSGDFGEDCCCSRNCLGKLPVRAGVCAEKFGFQYKNPAERGMRHLYCGAAAFRRGDGLLYRAQANSEKADALVRVDEQFRRSEYFMNCNPKKTNVILGDSRNAVGKDTITDTMCGNAVDLSPESFYQVNTIQAERLYGAAKEFAQLTGKERLLDLYCGAGTIGLSMADAVSELVGVEIVPEAVENAKENAARAGVKNAAFFCGDAGSIAGKLAEQGTAPDVIVVDPPRKGCDEAALWAMVQMLPERIVMISCNATTAARD
ncbi:MAG: 23S rRNA (uracil(1939)-C(5))-methyltransferase RlmD, partial [Ruminococcus sp.]